MRCAVTVPRQVMGYVLPQVETRCPMCGGEHEERAHNLTITRPHRAWPILNLLFSPPLVLAVGLAAVALHGHELGPRLWKDLCLAMAAPFAALSVQGILQLVLVRRFRLRVALCRRCWTWAERDQQAERRMRVWKNLFAWSAAMVAPSAMLEVGSMELLVLLATVGVAASSLTWWRERQRSTERSWTLPLLRRVDEQAAAIEVPVAWQSALLPP